MISNEIIRLIMLTPNDPIGLDIKLVDSSLMVIKLKHIFFLTMSDKFSEIFSKRKK